MATLTVAPNGSVTIESGTQIIAMSRFSERAQRLALDFGPGEHCLATALPGMSDATASDIADALA